MNSGRRFHQRRIRRCGPVLITGSAKNNRQVNLEGLVMCEVLALHRRGLPGPLVVLCGAELNKPSAAIISQPESSMIKEGSDASSTHKCSRCPSSIAYLGMWSHVNRSKGKGSNA